MSGRRLRRAVNTEQGFLPLGMSRQVEFKCRIIIITKNLKRKGEDWEGIKRIHTSCNCITQSNTLL
jgi:hypothetical protein